MFWCLFNVIFKAYLFILFTSAALAIFEALCNLRTGLRAKFVNLLLKLFDWGDKRVHRSRKSLKSRKLLNPSCTKTLIDKDWSQTLWQKLQHESTLESEHCFATVAEDTFDWIRFGMEVVITDQVTQSFYAAELPSWNLLSRTERGHKYVSFRLTLAWIVGAIFRYGFLFPTRVLILIFAILYTFVMLPIAAKLVPQGPFKRWLSKAITVGCLRITSRAIGLSVRPHDKQNAPKNGGICVANHTSAMDFITLGYGNYFAVVGQSARGFPGEVQKMLQEITPHIWFDRFNKSDRAMVLDRMMEHTSAGKPPILIFPEGVCVNNSVIMEFKKGSFEVGCTIHPVALVYDRRLGEPFWYQESWYGHLLSLMTAWAIVCDVYYLPPMTREEGESGIDFAQRCKTEIALKGGLIDVQFDGMLRYVRVKEDLIQKVKKMYANNVKQKLISVLGDDTEYLSADSDVESSEDEATSKPGAEVEQLKSTVEKLTENVESSKDQSLGKEFDDLRKRVQISES